MTRQTASPIALVCFGNPPVNALGAATRRALLDDLSRALADPAVTGIVLRGENGRFSGGADVREFDGPVDRDAPTIVEIGRAIAKGDKPVVALIEGIALGGGLELALFCHHRVSTPDARIGLPEATLGVLPGARGTQHLPRLVGAARAIEMMTTGRIVSGKEALDLGIVDRLVSEDALHDAREMAREAADRPLPRLLDRPVAVEGDDPAAFFAQARAAAGKLGRGPAPEAIVACVEAATTLSPEDAGRLESESFERLAASPEAKALQHLFFAERAAAKLNDVAPGTKPREIRRVGVLGAGTMGTGIAMAFANGGFETRIFDTNAAAMERSRTAREKAYLSAVGRGRMSEETADAARARLREATEMAELADCDLVVEAVIEDMAVKKAVFGQLDAILRPGAILATNTSFLNVDEIAGATKRPEDVVGLHFFSPAHIMRLVEVVRGARTADDVLATAMAVTKRLGKVGVVARVCEGFIGNRMVDEYVREANALLMEGASPRQVDEALRAFGFAMGPFAMSDMAGNDIGWMTRRRRREADPAYSYPEIADAVADRGWFGQKTGQGYHRYEPGSRAPLDNEAVGALLDELRERSGTAAREVSTDEIVRRCVGALVREGEAILREGIAERASDIDVVYVRGYGFPELKGGPMHWAKSAAAL